MFLIIVSNAGTELDVFPKDTNNAEPSGRCSGGYAKTKPIQNYLTSLCFKFAFRTSASRVAQSASNFSSRLSSESRLVSSRSSFLRISSDSVKIYISESDVLYQGSCSYSRLKKATFGHS